MGHRQRQLGLDRCPLGNGGPLVGVFETGESYRTGRADQEPDQLLGIPEDLGIGSSLDVPLEVENERRGVHSAMSTEPNRYNAP